MTSTDARRTSWGSEADLEEDQINESSLPDKDTIVSLLKELMQEAEDEKRIRRQKPRAGRQRLSLLGEGTSARQSVSVPGGGTLECEDTGFETRVREECEELSETQCTLVQVTTFVLLQ